MCRLSGRLRSHSVKEAPSYYARNIQKAKSALREHNKRSGPSQACVQGWDWKHSVVSYYRLRMHLLKVSFISWRWQKRLLAPLPNPHPPAFHGCQITSRVPCPAVIQNWIVLQGFSEWRLLYPDWVWNHGQACLILLCLRFNISKCTRACWLNGVSTCMRRKFYGKSSDQTRICRLISIGKEIQSGAVGGGFSLFLFFF